MSLVSFNPKTGQARVSDGSETTSAEVAAICERAAVAAPILADLGRAGRADLLEACARELEGRAGELVAVAEEETALGVDRLGGELRRTSFQFRLFASMLREGSYLGASIDHATETPIGHFPDLRRTLVPIGPVAVFGSSNFPFAFSVPGGDTAAALAAGCPVVIKAHPAHPATSQEAFGCLRAAAKLVGAPADAIALVHGQQAGIDLVNDPSIRAVAFTGSEAGGRRLFDIASRRAQPIPFYGELGSINPVIVTPTAAGRRGRQIAEGFIASMTAGYGQFCTKPGLLLVPEDAGTILDTLARSFEDGGQGWSLTADIMRRYQDGVDRLGEEPGVDVLAKAEHAGREGFAVAATLFSTGVERLSAPGTAILDECFGPVAVVLRYSGTDSLLDALPSLPGGLTASIHAEREDHALARRLVDTLSRRVGRIVWNAFPTGVAVSWSMTHGGPYPATTNALHTSVGPTSVGRFLRPVTFQDVPQELLPDELRDEGATVSARRVDGAVRLADDSGAGTA
jgi:NADP-dependent aldehyde dehydrogenase